VEGLLAPRSIADTAARKASTTGALIVLYAIGHKEESMSDQQHTGTPVLLDEALYAGFASYDFGAVKEFAAFELIEGVPQPVFKRVCTPGEKKKLKKLVYAQKCVRSIRHKCQEDGDEFQIFYMK
jgi:hypothetical protein